MTAALRAAALALTLILSSSVHSRASGLGVNYNVPVQPGSFDSSLIPIEIQLPAFTDPSGGTADIRRFRGRVVLVNFWATWCAPCIKEMTFLDRLQGDFKPNELAVIAISEDQGGLPTARSFMTQQKFGFLKPYADPTGAMAQALGIQGLPTSIIYDKQGHEVQRVIGPYEWDSPAILARFRLLVAAH
jgi:thiol-disulfide isomerase/thioredoxin